MDELTELLTELVEATKDLKNHPTKSNVAHVEDLTDQVRELLDTLDDPFRGF
jgi:hypothetical protein